MNYIVDEVNGRKVFKLQLPDGMTMDQVKDWLDKIKHEFKTRPLPVIENQSE